MLHRYTNLLDRVPIIRLLLFRLSASTSLMRLYFTVQVRTNSSSGTLTLMTRPRRYVPGADLEEYCIKTVSPTAMFFCVSINLRAGTSENTHLMPGHCHRHISCSMISTVGVNHYQVGYSSGGHHHK